MTRHFLIYNCKRYEFLKKVQIYAIYLITHKVIKLIFYRPLNYDTKKNKNRTIKDGFTVKL